MGYDINAFLLKGFKFKLSDAFERGWLDPSIMEDDDWMCLNMGDDTISIISKYIKSEYIKTMLLEDGWSLYILSSTQEPYDPDKSYVFIYNQKQDLDIDGVGDYWTGEVKDSGSTKENEEQKLDFNLMESNPDDYKQHWVIETSW